MYRGPVGLKYQLDVLFWMCIFAFVHNMLWHVATCGMEGAGGLPSLCNGFTESRGMNRKISRINKRLWEITC